MAHVIAADPIYLVSIFFLYMTFRKFVSNPVPTEHVT